MNSLDITSLYTNIPIKIPYIYIYIYICVCVCVCVCAFIVIYVQNLVIQNTHIQRHIYIDTYIESVRQWSGRPGSVPGRVIPKTLKMVLDTSLLNTQHYKVLSRVCGAIKGKE